MNTFFTEDLINLFKSKGKSFKVEFTIEDNTISNINFKQSLSSVTYNNNNKNNELLNKQDIFKRNNRINAALIKYCLDDNIDDFRQFVSNELNIDLSEFEKRALYYKEWKYIVSNVVDKTYLIKGWFGKAGDMHKIHKSKDEVYKYIKDKANKSLKNIFEDLFGNVDIMYIKNKD